MKYIGKVSFFRLFFDRCRGRKEGLRSPKCFPLTTAEIGLQEQNKHDKYISDVGTNIKVLDERISKNETELDKTQAERLKYTDLPPINLANNIYYSSIFGILFIVGSVILDAVGITYNIFLIIGDNILLSVPLAFVWNAALLFTGHRLGSIIKNPKTKKIIYSICIVFIIVPALGLTLLRMPLFIKDLNTSKFLSSPLVMISYFTFTFGITVIAPLIFGILLQEIISRISPARISRKIFKKENKISKKINDDAISLKLLNSEQNDAPFKLDNRKKLRQLAYAAAFARYLQKRPYNKDEMELLRLEDKK